MHRLICLFPFSSSSTFEIPFIPLTHKLPSLSTSIADKLEDGNPSISRIIENLFVLNETVLQYLYTANQLLLHGLEE